MFCIGCDRSLHGGPCGGLSVGRVSLGLFKCPICRLGEQGIEGEPEGPLTRATGTMLGEMQDGSENFAAKISGTQKLLRDFAAEQQGSQSTAPISPLDGVESMKAFIR